MENGQYLMKLQGVHKSVTKFLGHPVYRYWAYHKQNRGSLEILCIYGCVCVFVIYGRVLWLTFHLHRFSSRNFLDTVRRLAFTVPSMSCLRLTPNSTRASPTSRSDDVSCTTLLVSLKRQKMYRRATSSSSSSSS